MRTNILNLKKDNTLQTETRVDLFKLPKETKAQNSVLTNKITAEEINSAI